MKSRKVQRKKRMKGGMKEVDEEGPKEEELDKERKKK